MQRTCRQLLQPASGTGGARAPLLLAVPATLVAIALLVPIVYLVIRASESGVGTWDLVFRARTASLLWQTARLAGAVAIASILISVPYAWLVTSTDLRGARFWAAVAPLPLVIPSYAGTIAVLGALRPRGLVQGWLEPFGVEALPSIYGFWGAWATLTLFTYPYVFLAVHAGFRRIDATLEDASRVLHRGSIATFVRVTLPQLRPAMLSGSVLSVLYTVSDFGVVTLMRYDTFTRAIYTQYRAAFDRTLAAGLSVLLIVVAISLLAIEGRLRGSGRYYRIGTGAARPGKLVRLGRWNALGVCFCTLVMLAALGVPVSTMIYWLLTGESAGHQVSNLPSAAGHSVLLAVVTSLVILVCAFPVAMLVARYTSSRFGRSLESLSYLGYALPGIVIGLAFVFIGARYLPTFYQTLPLLMAAMVVKYVSQGIGMLRGAILQVSSLLEESSRVLGRSQVATIRAITIPLIAPGAGAAFILTFLTVMKELPMTLLLSPTGFTTLSTEIWSASDAGSFGRTAAPTLLLIGISIVPTLLLANRGGLGDGPAGEIPE